MLGALTAFCSTCYGVALLEFRRRRLNSPADVDEGLGIRVLPQAVVEQAPSA